jgi:hypothetical protein
MIDCMSVFKGLGLVFLSNLHLYAGIVTLHANYRIKDFTPLGATPPPQISIGAPVSIDITYDSAKAPVALTPITATYYLDSSEGIASVNLNGLVLSHVPSVPLIIGLIDSSCCQSFVVDVVYALGIQPSRIQLAWFHPNSQGFLSGITSLPDNLDLTIPVASAHLFESGVPLALIELEPVAVPEPSTIALVGLGLLLTALVVHTRIL